MKIILIYLLNNCDMNFIILSSNIANVIESADVDGCVPDGDGVDDIVTDVSNGLYGVVTGFVVTDGPDVPDVPDVPGDTVVPNL